MNDAAQLPRVSIVIPAYNEESVIRQCLIAAVYQSVPAHEIIVVDNLSTDRTAAIVQQMESAGAVLLNSQRPSSGSAQSTRINGGLFERSMARRSLREKWRASPRIAATHRVHHTPGHPRSKQFPATLRASDDARQ